MASVTDATQLLMDILSKKVTTKVDTRIRELVAKDLCICCGANPIWRDGNCRACDYEIETHFNSITTKSGRIAYMSGLYSDGKRLKPYEIRKYRKPMTDLAKRARDAS